MRPTLSILTVAALLTGCLPPERPLSPSQASRPVQVRVQEAPGGAVSAGTLVRLTADSVAWSGSGSDVVVRARALDDVARVEVAEPLSQREAFRRGAIKGGIVGAVLGGVLLAVKQDQVAGAVGLAAAGWWLGGVFAGQGVESSQPPVRWRVVHPAPAPRAGG
jgi:hypothetical protein